MDLDDLLGEFPDIRDSIETPFLKTCPRDKIWMLEKIETVTKELVESLFLEENKLVVELLVRGKPKHQRFDFGSGAIRATATTETRATSFPGGDAKEAWRFTVVLRILDLIHEALSESVTVTKRDIFYKDPELFGQQNTVDKALDDIAFTFGTDRNSMNVFATSKGLISGNLTMWKANGLEICAKESEGINIPHADEIDNFDISNLDWVLIIEKEATFRCLASNKFFETCSLGPGLLVTDDIKAKGYPDIATRRFLHELGEVFRGSFYCLVDFDPHGIGILSTYKYGSEALAHENERLSLPILKWLGVDSSDISGPWYSKRINVMMPLHSDDRRKAVAMLGKDIIKENSREPVWRRELQVMLMMNGKAELQAMDDGQSGGFCAWVEEKMISSHSSFR